MWWERFKHWLEMQRLAAERRTIYSTLNHFAMQRAETEDGEAWCLRELDRIAEREVHAKVRARRWQQHLPNKEKPCTSTN